MEQSDNRHHRVDPGPTHVVPTTLPGPEGLGKFDGTQANWPPFRDLFIALVDSKAYSSLSKLLYLKKACTGAAALAIGGYDPLQDCYQDAWQALKWIYDDKYAVTQALINRLLDLEPAKNDGIEELRRIIDTTTSTMRQLATLKHKVRHWDPVIINVMARKLPPTTVGAWEQQRKRDQAPKLQELLDYLDAKARSRLFDMGSTSREEKGDAGRNTRRAPATQKQEAGSRANYSRPLFQTVGVSSQCVHCKKTGHWLGNCPALKERTVKDRRAILLAMGVCLNCLCFGHYRFRCERPGCPRWACSGDKHHTMVCEKSAVKRPATNPVVRTIKTTAKHPRNK